MKQFLKHQKILACFLILFLLPFFNLPSALATTADEGIELSIAAKNPANAIVYSGQNVTATFTFKANLQDPKFENAYLSFEPQNGTGKYIKNFDVAIDYATSDVFSRADNSDIFGAVLGGLSGFTERKIYFKQAGTNQFGAKEAEAPITIKVKDYVTPNDAQIPIKLSLKLADGSTVATAPQLLTITSQTGKQLYNVTIPGRINNNAVYGGTSANGTTIDANGAVDVDFVYQPAGVQFKDYNGGQPSFAQGFGNRRFATVKYTQPLPRFAVFNQAKNPGWTLDNGTNTVSFTAQNEDNSGNTNLFSPATLKLTFPNAAVQTNYTASSTATFTQSNPAQNEQPLTDNRSVTYSFVGSRIIDQSSVKAFVMETGDPYTNEVTLSKSRLDKQLKWKFFLKNSQQENLNVAEWEDKDLDSRLMYSYIKTVKTAEQDYTHITTGGILPIETVTNVQVFGLMEDGSEKILGTLTQNQEFPIPKADALKIKKLKVKNFTVTPGKVAVFEIGTTFKGFPETMPTVSASTSQNKYYNTAGYTGSVGTTQVIATSKTSFTLKAQKIDINIKLELDEKINNGWFNNSSSFPLRKVGDFAIWDISKNLWNPVVSGVPDEFPLDDLKFVLLLPDGVTYNRLETAYYSGRPAVTFSASDAKYVSNYNNSGLNAVVISMPKGMTSGILNDTFNRQTESTLKVVTTVNKNSWQGQNFAYLLPNYAGNFLTPNPSALFLNKPYTDVYDINQNGKTNDKLVGSEAYYNFQLASEIIAREYIGRGGTAKYGTDILNTSEGSNFSYQLKALNNRNTDIPTLEFYNLLPYVNDYTPTPSAATNQYEPRESQFSNIVTGPLRITTPNANNYTIEYTTEDLKTKSADGKTGLVKNPSDLAWVSEAALGGNFENVTGVRVKLNPGATFARNTELIATLPMRTPMGVPLNAEANDNWVLTTDNGTTYVPTNTVTNQIYTQSAKLAITKQNQAGTKLQGAEFTVTRTADNKTWKLITNAEGIALLAQNDPEGLPANAKDNSGVIFPLGNYTYLETKAPAFHALPSPNNATAFEIVEDNDIEKTVINNPIPGTTQYRATKSWVNGPEEKPQVFMYLEYLVLNFDGTPHRLSSWTKLDDSETELPKGVNELLWQNLPRYDDYGNPVKYRVRERIVKKFFGPKYDPTYEDDNYNPMTDDGTGGTTAVTNTFDQEKRDIKFTKTWKNGTAPRPDITITLHIDQTPSDRADAVQVLHDGQLTYTWKDLPNYDLNGKTILYYVKESPVEGYAAEYDLFGRNITNFLSTSFTATKTWVNGPAKKPTVVFWLQQNGVDYPKASVAKKMLPDGTTTVTWEDLPKFDDAGTPYVYTVREDAVEGYTTTYNDAHTEVINTYVQGTTEFTATKVWANGPTEKPPITFVLQQNGADYTGEGAEITLQPGTLTATWSNLPKTDLNGETYTYTVKEKEVEDYVASYNETGNEVTNTFNQGTKDFTVTKTWVNGPTEKPEITLVLQQNGQDYAGEGASQTLPNGTTTVTWSNLPVKALDGTTYTYTVREEPVEGYTTAYTSATEVTNTYDQGTTEFTATKVWVNGPTEKPTVTFVLQQNGQDYTGDGATKTLPNGTTSVTWSDLPAKATDGTAYTYSVREEAVTDYTTEYNDTATQVTNTYNQGKTTFTATKVWVNGPAEKPTVTFVLQQNGQDYTGDGATKTLPNGTTSVTWNDLPAKATDGTAYTYSVREDAVTDYTTEYNDAANQVTNTYNQGKTTFTATKVWVNGPTEKPTVTFVLQQNGQDYTGDGATKTLPNGTTSVTWSDLPAKATDGTAYTYSVREDAVTDYTTEYNDTATQVTNTYNQGKTTFTATKVWVNGPTEKPTVTFVLQQNGQDYTGDGATKTLPNGTTSVTWTDLPAKATDGTAYTYSVREEAVAGYTTRYNTEGNEVTNEFIVVPKPKFTVTYVVVNGTWADATTANKTETVEENALPANVPVGMIANAGFEGGAWDKDPTTTVITEDTVFTFTFTPIPATPTPSETPTPTPEPTAEPTVEPSVEPTAEPTAEPTLAPSATPSPTLVPINAPKTGDGANPRSNIMWLLVAFVASIYLIFRKRKTSN